MIPLRSSARPRFAAGALVALGAAVLLAAAPPARAQGTAIPPAPDRYVTDKAGFLSPAAVDRLDARLQDFDRSTGHQVLVYIDRTTGDVPIEDWAVRAFEKWRVGRKGIDDGVVLFIFAQDRRARIEVGYGLEPVVPDIQAGRIINEVLAPKLRAGDNDAAVTDAVDEILRLAGGGAPVAPSQPEAEPGAGRSTQKVPGHPILYIIGIVIFLIILITNPRLALFLLWMMMSGGRGGGGGFGGGRGGGGFRGGGGRSGGGGASGSW